MLWKAGGGAAAIEALPQYEIEAKKRQGERTDLDDNINQKIDESKINNKQSSQQVASRSTTLTNGHPRTREGSTHKFMGKIEVIGHPRTREGSR